MSKTHPQPLQGEEPFSTSNKFNQNIKLYKI